MKNESCQDVIASGANEILYRAGVIEAQRDKDFQLFAKV